jgi:hypothetical protein
MDEKEVKKLAKEQAQAKCLAFYQEIKKLSNELGFSCEMLINTIEGSHITLS